MIERQLGALKIDTVRDREIFNDPSRFLSAIF